MYSVRLLNYNYVWGKRYVFDNFLKIYNDNLADFISVGNLFHSLAAVTIACFSAGSGTAKTK